jgi:uncharacterized SAM-binding protein YcdF (DUF218 family)
VRKLIFFIVLAIALRLTLPWFGTALVVSDPIERADAIVVLASNRMDRVYEAGMLYREGRSTRILLSHPDETYRRAIPERLGLSIPTDYDLQRSALRQMGIPDAAVHELAGNPQSTEDEAAIIARFSRQQRLKTLILVTSSYHSRRAALYVRSAAGSYPRVAIRPSRFDSVKPEEWWRRPYDRADVVLEWLKLPKCGWALLKARFSR